MKKALLCFLMVNFLLLAGKKEVRWQRIFKLAGKDEPDYMLFLPSDMKFDGKGNVYIADLKGCFLRKYSIKGKFLGEVGREGSGPGEFRAPFKIFVQGESVFVWDMRLRRLSVFDTDLTYRRSYHLPFNINDFFVVNGKIYASVSSPHDLDNIFVINMKGDVLKKTLPVLPSYLKRNDKWLFLNRIRFGFMVLGYNPRLKKAAATFRGYDPRNFLYVFSPEEEKIKALPIDFLKDHSFPDFLLKPPFRYPQASRQILVESIHPLDNGDFLIVLLEKNLRGKRTVLRKTLFIILSKEGKIIAQNTLKGIFRIYDVLGDEALLKNMDEEEEIFQVWRINYEK